MVIETPTSAPEYIRLLAQCAFAHATIGGNGLGRN